MNIFTRVAVSCDAADPKKRVKGAFGMLGLLGLLGSTLCFAAHQLKWSHPAWLKL